jgi:hypothetical protein
MYYLVYKITNTINDKIYIGCHKTENINDGYFGSGKVLKLAIKKYGVENFIKEIIYEASNSEEMFEKEKQLVEIGKHSYNLKTGGQGGFDFINQNMSDEERIRISKLGAKGFKNKLETDLEFSNHFKEKMREITNQRHKDGTIATWKDTYSWLGKRHKEETRQKMSSTHKQRGNHIGEKNSQYGKMWITNGQISSKINKTEVIPDGWYKGRVNGTKPY